MKVRRLLAEDGAEVLGLTLPAGHAFQRDLRIGEVGVDVGAARSRGAYLVALARLAEVEGRPAAAQIAAQLLLPAGRCRERPSSGSTRSASPPSPPNGPRQASRPRRRRVKESAGSLARRQVALQQGGDVRPLPLRSLRPGRGPASAAASREVDPPASSMPMTESSRRCRRSVGGLRLRSDSAMPGCPPGRPMRAVRRRRSCAPPRTSASADRVTVALQLPGSSL